MSKIIQDHSSNSVYHISATEQTQAIHLSYKCLTLLVAAGCIKSR